MLGPPHVVDSEAPVLPSIRHLGPRDVDEAHHVTVGRGEAVGGDAAVVGQGGAVQLPGDGGRGVAGELTAQRDLLTPLHEPVVEAVYELWFGG